MSAAAARVAGYAGALALVFAAALGLGGWIGPEVDGATASSAHDPVGHVDPQTDHSPDGATADGHGDHTAAGEAVPAGLQTTQDGYSLHLLQSTLPAGDAVELAFHVLGQDGRPVLDYQVEHEQLLHLIAVRRDLSGFQHVHPTLAADGTWRTSLGLTPGAWRVFADFRPSGAEAALTLGTDVLVPGDHQPVPLPPPDPSATVDGYAVLLDGELVAGQETELVLTVSRAGRPVTDLEPYLGAYGHLVALRTGDLAYLHVHPLGHPVGRATDEVSGSPTIRFAVTAPSGGDYRLYLDFRHGGTVRTAAFTVAAAGTADGHTHEPAP